SRASFHETLQRLAARADIRAMINERAAEASDPRMFGDRYAVEARLGSGGMGIVYRATDRLLGRQVAIKVLRSEIAAMEVNGSSVLNEARAVATLNHPSIAAVHDLWESGGLGYIVMEYVRGCALWQLRLDGFQFTPEEGIAITH